MLSAPFFRISLAAAAALLVAQCFAQVTVGWKVVGPTPSSYVTARGLTTDGAGNIYSLSQVGAKGAYERRNGFGALLNNPPIPHGTANVIAVAHDSSGNAFVLANSIEADSEQHMVVNKFSPSGQYLGYFVVPRICTALGIGVSSADKVILAGSTHSDANPALTTLYVQVLADNLQFVTGYSDENVNPASVQFDLAGDLLAVGNLNFDLGYGGSIVSFHAIDGSQKWGSTYYNQTPTPDLSDIGTMIASLAPNGTTLLGTTVEHREFLNSSTSHIVRLVASSGANIWPADVTGNGSVTLVAHDNDDYSYITGGGTSPYLEAYNATGALRWHQDETAPSIYADGSNGLLLVSTGAVPGASSAIRLKKYNNAGITAWTLDFSDPAGADSASFVKIVGGRIYILGTAAAQSGVAPGQLLVSFVQGLALSTVSPSALQFTGGSSGSAVASLTGINTGAPRPISLSNGNPHVTVPSTIYVPPGANNIAFTVDSAGVDANEQAKVYLRSSGVERVLTVNVMAAGLQSSSISRRMIGGNLDRGAVTLSGKAGPSGCVVSLASNNSNVVVPASVTVPAQATYASFTVNVHAVSFPQTATLQATYRGVGRTSTGTVYPAQFSAITPPALVVCGNKGIATLSVDGVAGADIPVSLSDDHADLAPLPSSITIPSGSASVRFSFTTSGVDSDTLVTITATAQGITKTGYFTLAAAGLSQLYTSPSTVAGGSPSNGVLRLNGVAGPGGATIALSSNNPHIHVPSTVTLSPGRGAISFPIQTDLGVAQATISATYRGNTLQTSITTT
jgi:hypothetical protein